MQRNAGGQPPERESPRLSLTPATQPLPRTLLPLLAAGKKGDGGGFGATAGWPSDRLLQRELLPPPPDVAWAAAAAECGARAGGGGGGGLDDELGRRTADPPTARQTAAAAPASRSSTVEGRLLEKLGLESFTCMLLSGAATHTAGSFSLSGETELATSAASAMDAPDAAGVKSGN